MLLQDMPMNRSFMHLHLGFDASGLDNLELHHIVVNSWEGGVDTEQACILSCIHSSFSIHVLSKCFVSTLRRKPDPWQCVLI